MHSANLPAAACGIPRLSAAGYKISLTAGSAEAKGMRVIVVGNLWYWT